MHLNEDELVLHYYGEMTPGEEQRAAAHLADCAPCHSSLTALQRALAAVDAAPAPEPADGFERTMWARLEPALPSRRAGWFSWLAIAPARLALAAGLVVLVAGAFLAGRLWQRGGPEPSVQTAGGAKAAEDVRERVLLIDLGEHLDLSQMMLVELVSAGDETGMDMSAESARAEQLLAANRLYRQTAEATGDTGLAQLLDELERVLVDVSASPGQMSADDIAQVRQRIDHNGLLFKVRVVSSEVRERQKARNRMRAGQSS